MGYTFTCNPKRAIYDLALFQGTQYTPSLPYCVSKKQADNSTINYIASTTYVQNDLSVSGGTSFRGIGNFNSFMNNQGNVLNPEFCYFMLQSKHYTTHTSEFIDYGFTRTAFPTVGLYASGYSKSKNPLRVCDLVITQKEYAPNSDSESSFVKLEGENTLDGNKATGEFHSVTFIQSPHSVKAFDFGYPDFYCSQDNKLSGKGSHLYLYQRGAVQTKGKYISSIALGAYSKELYQNSVNSKKDQSSLDGIKFSADMYAMSSACSVSADEVIIKNLAINQSEAWYNSKGKFSVIVPDWKSKTHVHAKYEGDFAKQSTTPSDSDTAAYIGVTRTDNPKQAITGALLVQNDKWTTEKTIKIGRVVYYCDAIQTPMRVNGHNYYLYYTYNTGVNAGQPIEEISVDGNALVQGAATAVCAKDSDIDSERVTYADSSIPSFLHLYYDHSNLKSAFFNKLYIGTGKTKNAALLELAANECVEFVDLDLNDGASGESVYFGFRYGVLDRAAIKEKRDDDAKKAEQRAQMQEAICDVIVTEGEPYHPEGFIADNLVYYVPVADKNLNAGNLGDELYMYYTSDYVSSAYNKRNNAATYLAYDVFTPIKSFAFSRFDCVPYNEHYVSQTGKNDLAVYEYVMRSDEKLPIDLNADILVTDGDYKAKGDNRISMFVSRLDNSVKPSAEITGGYVGKTTDVGTLKLTKKPIR